LHEEKALVQVCAGGMTSSRNLMLKVEYLYTPHFSVTINSDSASHDNFCVYLSYKFMDNHVPVQQTYSGPAYEPLVVLQLV
jgi:hypothetical protein